MKTTVCQQVVRASTAMGLLLGVASSHALIATNTPEMGGSTPELVLWMFDPVAEVSFTKDLGVYVAPFNKDLDNSKNFFVQAQQDSGYQKFFDPLNSDANFKKFLAASKDVKNQIWAVFAASDVDFFGPGAKNVFTTLKSTDTNGVLNPRYQNLVNLNNQLMGDLAGGNFASMFGDLNNGLSSSGGDSGASNLNNSHFKDVAIAAPEDYLLYNGSSFDVKGTAPYLGFYIKDLDKGIGNVLGNTFNAVNSSSWFYYLTQRNANSTDKILVDEFDNLSHDGYWGLAVDEKGDYLLSFTMEAHLTKATTAAGLARRSWIDFAAAYGEARVLSVSVDEFAGWVSSSNLSSVTAVPEPATYGLMGLGLLILGARARKRV